MNAEAIDLRGLAERHCLRLLENGRGMHAYVLHKAEGMEQEYPWCEGLVAVVERALGPKATQAAREDIRILLGTPAKAARAAVKAMTK